MITPSIYPFQLGAQFFLHLQKTLLLRFFHVILFFPNKSSTLPNIASENGWLEYEAVSFWGPAYFQARLLLVSGRVSLHSVRRQKMNLFHQTGGSKNIGDFEQLRRGEWTGCLCFCFVGGQPPP